MLHNIVVSMLSFWFAFDVLLLADMVVISISYKCACIVHVKRS